MSGAKFDALDAVMVVLGLPLSLGVGTFFAGLGVAMVILAGDCHPDAPEPAPAAPIGQSVEAP